MSYQLANMNTKEEDLRAWRDRVIMNIPEDDKWYAHPNIPNYAANTRGELYNTKTGRPIKGGQSAGRQVLSWARVDGRRCKRQFHRVLMECLFNTSIPDDFQIDHRDANPLNNAFSNLQILTKKEHAQKTADDNPDRGKKAGLKSSRAVMRFRKHENGEITDEALFDSVNDATRLTSATHKRIRRSIKGSIPDSSGYYWMFVDQDDDLPGEEWRQAPGRREGMLVSNMGRVCFSYRPRPYKTYGSMGPGGYFTFSCDERAIKVHQAVCLAFNGPPPAEGYTVDHIDRNEGNNCVENLRWASPDEQSKNRDCIRPVEVFDRKNPGVAVKTFDTEAEVAREYDVNQNTVSQVVRFQTISQYHKNNVRSRVAYCLSRTTTLSARYADMTNEEKMNREMAVLEYQAKVALHDKNKRKSNPHNLPIGVTRNSKGGLVASMTFLGVSFQKCGGKDPEALARARNEWFESVVEKQRGFIRAAFGQSI
jgi:HNH endonuclease